ncbi:stress-regulated transcription factor [Saccharomycopsis crataegensis]|uniref:Stress-regulated transcription factor n=1 Tax=Saccharomycopsis crataegensis TaxID=43959 RepID=A0AAV5QV97_9ASCO|nr:stress-regulated transcription factor [Saccharomycopsis crataegensis]
MTSYAVFPSLNRPMSDILEDELYHVNSNLPQQSGSPKFSNKMFDSSEFLNIQQTSDTDNNYNFSKIYTTSNNSQNSVCSKSSTTANTSSNNNNNNNAVPAYQYQLHNHDSIQPFNEYANPDVELNGFSKPQPSQFGQNFQQFNPFASGKLEDEMLFNVNIYDNDLGISNSEIIALAEKHTFDSIPSLHFYNTMEIPYEDLEDYGSDDEDEDEDEDRLIDVNDDPFFYAHDQENDEPGSVYEAPSTPNTSVLPSPQSSNGYSNYLASNKQFLNESAIFEDDDNENRTLKSMDVDSSDVSDYEDSFYEPKFDTAALIDNSSRAHSFINNNDQEVKKFRKNTLKPISLNTLNNTSGKLKTVSTKNNPIQKIKHRHSQSISNMEVGDINKALNASSNSTLVISPNCADSDENNQCMLINPSTNSPCLKKFSRPYDLIRHQETIHASKKKIFRCMICENNYKKSLDDAQANGETDKPLHSPKTFSRGDALSRHIRVKHSLTGEAVTEALKYAKDNVEYINIC